MKIRECCAYVFRSFFRRGSTVKSKPGESLPVFLLCDSLKSMKTSEQNCTADLSGRGEETDWGWVPIESILCLGPDVQRMNPRSLLVYRKPSVKLVMTSFGWWRQDQCSSEFSRDQWDPVQAQSKGWCPGVYSRCGDVSMYNCTAHTQGDRTFTVPYTSLLSWLDIHFYKMMSFLYTIKLEEAIISFPKTALLTYLRVLLPWTQQ